MRRNCLALAAMTAALVAVTALTSLATATAADAETVTIGATLPGRLMEPAPACVDAGGCGVLTVAAGSPAEDVVAPVDGTVTRWRVQGAANLPGYSINVMRRHANGTYTVTASSQAVTPEGGGLETFATDLPIQAGEYVELNVASGGPIPTVFADSTLAEFAPAPGPGATVAPREEAGTFVSGAYNVDIETAPVIEPAPIKEVITKTVQVDVPVSTTAEPHCLVPKLSGMKLAVAKRALLAAGCRVGLVLPGRRAKASGAKVRRAVPKGGAVLPAGTRVSIRLW